MKIKGIPASPGIAIGRAYLVSEESYCVIKRNIGDSQVKHEINRFKKAVSRTEEEFKKQKEKVIRDMGKKYARLFDAYMLILKDPLMSKDTIKIITSEKVNVEYALQTVIDRITKTFSMLDDEYMRDRVRDVQDVGTKVMRDLLGQKKVSLKEIQNRVALVAHTLHPSDAVEMKKENVIGFVTDVGGKTSHIVIMAESLEIPAVVGLKNVTRQVSPGDLLIIDGNNGTVFINPEPDTVREYRRRRQEQEEVRKQLIKLKDLPSVTKCGQEVELSVNIESADEVTAVEQYGAHGVGLFRTEYLYLNRKNLPNEEEIYKELKGVVSKIDPKPVIVRTLDLGADKLSAQLGIKPEGNPFMGLRGIRLCLAYPGIFKSQLKAILRASVHGNICIMYPMITGVKEMVSANHVLSEVKEELNSRGIEYNKNLRVGTMIETPAAALDIEHIADESDFVSIGTNDLIQYTMAVDRVSEEVSYLYNPADISILQLIKKIIIGAESRVKWIGMCGEMASDTLYTELLLGMGLRKLSMSGVSIPKVKKLIRNTTIEKCRDLVQRIFSSKDTKEILNILKINRNEMMEKKE
ncbi:MAG: phosphoenolpyruvate--protein phosphotransferase [Elusimicrobiota bacterium]